MMKKVLFGILAIASVLAGLFASVVGFFSLGLGLSGSGVGAVLDVIGTLGVFAGIFGVVMGIIKLRKSKTKQAFLFVLLGVILCAVYLLGFTVNEAVSTIHFEQEVAAQMEELYGEGWNSAPAIEGIPELYQEVLNKFYVVVKNRWSAEELMDLGAVAMPDYYGDVAEENIGFALMDLNGDQVDELVIGTTNPAEGEGTILFCIFSDPKNPFYSFSSVEGEIHYLHTNAADGSYLMEVVNPSVVWQIQPAQEENVFDFIAWDGTVDPSGRMTLELIPFSQYK